MVITLVDLGVGVTQLDGNVSDQLVLETNSLDTRDGLDDGGLSVSDVADGANVDGSLSGDNLGRQRSQAGDVEVFGLGLGRQRRSLSSGLGDSWVGLLESRLEGLLISSLVVTDRLSRVRLGPDVVVFGVVVGRHDEGGAIQAVFQMWFLGREVAKGRFRVGKSVAWIGRKLQSKISKSGEWFSKLRSSRAKILRISP